MEKPITDKEFMNILNTYYSIKERKDIKLRLELGIKYDDISMSPNIKIFYDSYIQGQLVSIPVTEEEITEALSSYAKNLGYQLSSFQYVGGVQRMGMYHDEDKPIFAGVILNLKDKVKTRKK